MQLRVWATVAPIVIVAILLGKGCNRSEPIEEPPAEADAPPSPPAQGPAAAAAEPDSMEHITIAAAPPRTGRVGDVHPDQELIHMSTPAAAVALIRLREQWKSDNADEAILKQARDLLPQQDRDRLRSSEDLERLWPYLRLEPKAEHLLTWLNLLVVEKSIREKDAKLNEVLGTFSGLFTSQLRLSAEEARNPDAIQKRIEQLRPFYVLFDGFHPARGPRPEAVAECLRHAGLPALPTKVSAPLLIEGKHWVVDLEIELGLGRTLRIAGQPVANARGYMYGPDVARLDLTTVLRSVAADAPEVSLGANCIARVERLTARDNRIVADLSIALPGSQDRVLVTGVSPNASREGRVSWEWVAGANGSGPPVNPLDVVPIEVVRAADVLARMASQPSVKLDVLRELSSDRKSGAVYREAVARLGKRIAEDPRRWLETALAQNGRAEVHAEAGRLEAAFALGEQSFVYGPVVITADGAVHLPAADRVQRVRTNVDVVRNYLAERVSKHWPAAAAAINVQGLRVNPAAGTVGLHGRWSCPMLDEPIDLSFEVSTRGDAKSPDLGAVLKKALAGRTVNLGQLLTVTLSSDPGPNAGWPATLAVAGLQLPVELSWENGQPRLKAGAGFDNAILRVVNSKLPAGTDSAVRVEIIGLHLPSPGESAAVRLKVHFAGSSLDVDVNEAGAHVCGIPEFLAKTIAEKLSKDWPVRIRRIQQDGPAHIVDADLLANKVPLLSVDGARFEAGRWTRTGDVRIHTDVLKDWTKNLKFGGAGIGVEVKRLRLNGQLLPVADLELRIAPDPDPFVLADVPLAPNGIADFERWADAALQVFRQRRPQGLKGSIGPWALSLVPKPGDDAAAFIATLTWPDQGLSLECPEAKYDFRAGLRPGPVRWKADAVAAWCKSIAPRIAALLSAGRAVPDLQIVVENPRAAAQSLESAKVLFDVAVRRGEHRVVIKDNELSASGLKLGSCDLAPLLRDVAARSIADLSFWQNQKTVDLGPGLRLTVVKFDVAARTVVVAVEILGEKAGEADIDFSKDRPSVRWRDSGALMRAVRSALAPLQAKLSDDRVRVTGTRLASDHVELDIELKPEPLADFLPAVTVRIGGEGIRFKVSSDEIEKRLWAEVAKRLNGLSFRLDGVPLNVVASEAKAEPKAVTFDVTANVDGLGSFPVRGIRIDRDGLHFNRDALLNLLLEAATRKLRELMPDSVLTLKSARVQDGEVHLVVSLNLGLGDPIEVSLRIDGGGKLHGLDAKQFAAIGFNKLAEHIKGRSIDLPGGGKLTVTDARVTTGLDGVELAGELILFEPFGAKVTNVVFKGNSLDTSKMTIEPTGLAEVMKKIGIGGSDGPVSFGVPVPILDAKGFRGFSVTANITIAKLCSAGVTVRITADKGLQIDFPIKLQLAQAQIPIPPFFALKKPMAELAREYVKIGCTFAFAAPATEMLIRYDASFRVPLKSPYILRADGDLTLLSFVPLGHQEAVLDLEDKKFTSKSTFRLPGVLTIDGSLLCRFDKLEVAVDGSMKVFGANMAEARLRLDGKGLDASARVSLLLVTADAQVHCEFDRWTETWFKSSVTFGIHAFGMNLTIAGARVEASLRPSASLTAIILNQELKIFAIDLSGITLERILDALMSNSISLTGWKLLAMKSGNGRSGGAGAPAPRGSVTADGTMVAILPDGTRRCLYATPSGAIVMLSSQKQPDGSERRRIEIPSANQVLEQVVDASGTVTKEERRWLFGESRLDDRAAPPPLHFPIPPDLLRKDVP